MKRLSAMMCIDLAILVLMLTAMVAIWITSISNQLAQLRYLPDLTIPRLLVGDYRTHTGMSGYSLTVCQNGEVEQHKWSCTLHQSSWGFIDYDEKASKVRIVLLKDPWMRPQYHMRHASGQTQIIEYVVVKLRYRIVLVELDRVHDLVAKGSFADEFQLAYFLSKKSALGDSGGQVPVFINGATVFESIDNNREVISFE